MEPKTYKLRKDITKEELLDNGFRKCYGGYIYSRNLYKKSIVLTVKIANDMELEYIAVEDIDLKQVYIPFYNDTYSFNNEVLKSVKRKYATVMNELVKKGIFRNDKNRIRNKNTSH